MGDVVALPSRKPLGPMTATGGLYGQMPFFAPGVLGTFATIGCRKCEHEVTIVIFTCGCSASGQPHRAFIPHPCVGHAGA